MTTPTDGTNLSEKIRQRADADHLPADHSLRLAADDFDSATHEFHTSPTVCIRRLISTWARVRRTWCEYSGEALV
jgi:hypothetical protein